MANTLDGLFERYVADLSAARETALRRREGQFQTWTKRLGSEARAKEKLEGRAPACTDVRVIGVLRKYWLEYQRFQPKPVGAATDPREFLLGRLRQARLPLAAFLEPLPYWPMGKDEKGTWV